MLMRRPLHRRWLLSPRTRRIVLTALCVVTALFVLVNIALWLLYRNRTYPNTQLLGATVGNTPYSQLSQKVDRLNLLPDSLQLIYQDKKTTLSLEELGIRQEPARATDSANRQRSWLPIFNILKSPRLKAPVAVDSSTLAAKAKELAVTFHKEPVNARLSLSGTSVEIIEGKSGYSFDGAKLQQLILASLDASRTQVTVAVRQISPGINGKDLHDDQQSLRSQLAVPIIYRYNGKARQVNGGEIASWFVPSGESFAISTDNLHAFITQVGKDFGIRIKDSNNVAATTAKALNERKGVDITLVAQIAIKTYTYCTAVKSVDAANLPAFRSKLKAAYADSRGWSLNGLVEYKEASSGCDFTVWLSAAALMPSFGAICDSMWSCRVGPNVVINYDRWTNASPAWNAAGGTLEEYRNMVINHETGHWLGFAHRHCAGAGQAAPVMQQQSIDLQGCSFNAWPVTAELATLRQKLGI